MSIINSPLTNVNVADATDDAEALALQNYEEKYPEELRKNLVDLTSDLEVEQKVIRLPNIQEWKYLDCLWQGLQNIWWNENALDWRPFTEGQEGTDLEDDDFGKIINVYRGYGESIIAGLSASLPGVRFAPDNADNPDDISTAKAYDKISNLISVHNNASQALVKCLFILFNQSFVACYNYRKEDPAFGTVKTPKVVAEKISVQRSTCTNCGEDISNEPLMEVDGQLTEMMDCPICFLSVIPEITFEDEIKLIPTYVECPKGREILEFYGPMNVQVPFYVDNLKNSPYLILETEHHLSLARAMFPHLAKKILGTSSYSSYERWARQPSEVYQAGDIDLVTFRRVWLRPWAYYMIENEDHRKHLQETYPSGCYFLLLNDVFAEACEENIDDHWTITQSPTSNYIHAAPIGRPLKDIQEMTNDMYNLTLRTILYGIPMTFVDANVIDWDKFRETPSEPGMVYPAKTQPGQNLDGSFHTVKTATLNKEVDTFTDRLNGAGQFVSGAFPSIFGGTIQGGSGTYKEYEASRTQALQRLSLIWKMVNIFWKDVMTKSCKEYAKNLLADESYVKRTGDSFVNVWIRRAEMQGKIGEVEAESSDQFPVSEIQKRGLILELMMSPSQVVQQFFGSVLGHPENIGTVTRQIGMGQLYIPGDDQRNKQLRENTVLMASEPVQTGQVQMDQLGKPVIGPDGMPQMQIVSSVPIEEFDDDTIHAEVLKALLVSDQGQYIKETNPPAFQNLVLHYNEHNTRLQMIAQQQMMQQMEMQNAGRSGNSGSNNGNSGGDGGSKSGSGKPN